MGILRRGRLRSASTLSFLPCPACSFVNSKDQSTIPKMSRIYLWGRQQRKRNEGATGWSILPTGSEENPASFYSMCKRGWWLIKTASTVSPLLFCSSPEIACEMNCCGIHFKVPPYFMGGFWSFQIGSRSFLLRVISQRCTARFSGGVCPLVRGSCELPQKAQPARSHRASPAVTLHRSQLSETGIRPGR